MRAADGRTLAEAAPELAEVRVMLGPTGLSVHVRLVFRDPDPVEGQATELWEGQLGKARGAGTDPLGAAAATLNNHYLLTAQGVR